MRAALGTDDIDRMRTAKDALQQAMYKVGEHTLRGGQRRQRRRPGDDGQSTSGGAADDDTVGREFKEEPQ